MYLDHDFVETPEGFLFCVVGCVHPERRVIAYLKYALSKDGRWGWGKRRFRRTMSHYSVPEVLNNIEMLRSGFPQYVFRSRVLGIEMSAVPERLVVHHYRPTERLRELLASREMDQLEKDTVEFTEKLSHISGVSKDSLGVTGSILTRIHNPSFSDMDITVYGRSSVEKIKYRLVEEYGHGRGEIRFPQGKIRERVLKRWAEQYRLTPQVVKWFARRKWNRGWFQGRLFSLLPVHSPSEVHERYGERRYVPGRIVEGQAEVVDVRESFFLPCTYGVTNVVMVQRRLDVKEITSYDAFYSGIFQPGDDVWFRGKLETVVDVKTGQEYCRILVGSPEARGLDYIRPRLGRSKFGQELRDNATL